FTSVEPGARLTGEMETHHDLRLLRADHRTCALGRFLDLALCGNGRLAALAFLLPRTAQMAWAESSSWDHRWCVSADLLQSHYTSGPGLLDCPAMDSSSRYKCYDIAASDMGPSAHWNSDDCAATGYRG